MGILDQSNKNNCSCNYSTAPKTADSGYCCNITPEKTESSCSDNLGCNTTGTQNVAVGSCNNTCTSTCTSTTKTPDSGYCCNITPSNSSACRLARRRGRRR